MADPMAATYQDFVMHDWPAMEATLTMNAMTDREIAGNVMPNILRWLQVHMCDYFLDLQRGRANPVLPPFRDLARLVQRRTFNLLPDIPTRYRVAMAPPHHRSAATLMVAHNSNHRAVAARW